MPAASPSPPPGRPEVALRQATAADMPAVVRLIQELATCEREPDAPTLTAHDLVRDGFPPPSAEAPPPAFHVILAVVARADGGATSGGGRRNNGGDYDGGGRDDDSGGTGGAGGGGDDGGGGVPPPSDGVVGMALWHHTYSTWTGRCLYVEDLIVTERWRRAGIGRRLLRAAAAAAVATRCARMDWVVCGWNRRAVDFYARAGARVQADLRHMRVDGHALRALGGEGGEAAPAASAHPAD